MTRTVILTLGETWPSGHKLIGPVSFSPEVPVYNSWSEKEVKQYASLVMEGSELVTYTEIPHNIDTQFVSCGIKTEIKNELDMVDSVMIALFIATRI